MRHATTRYGDVTATHNYDVSVKATLAIMLPLTSRTDCIRASARAADAAGRTDATARRPAANVRQRTDDTSAVRAAWRRRRTRGPGPGDWFESAPHSLWPAAPTCLHTGPDMIHSDPIDSSPTRAEPAAAAPNHAVVPGDDALHQLVASAGNLSQRGVEQWRGQAEAWRDGASAHVRAHPMRSVVLAASTGALLALLLRALSR